MLSFLCFGLNLSVLLTVGMKELGRTLIITVIDVYILLQTPHIVFHIYIMSET